MKWIAIIFLLAGSLAASAQDTLVLSGDTIACQITGIEASGLRFNYQSLARRASVDLVDAMYYRGAWYDNRQVRGIAADRLAGRPNPLDEVPIVMMDVPMHGAALHLDRAGKGIQVGIVVMMISSVAGILLVEENPGAAIVLTLGGGVGSIIAFLMAGDELRKSARAMQRQ